MKKWMSILCVIASFLVIGTTVNGWIADKDTEKDAGTSTASVCVVNE